MCRIQLVVIGTLVMSSPVSAASFDCARATIPRDRLICQSSTLSALDAQLGKTYQEKRAKLSPHGAAMLQTSERSWLKYVNTVCPMTPTSHDPRATPVACLTSRYQERLSELGQVAKTLGPFIFNRIDLFAAEPHVSSDETGSVPGFYFQHFSYPQIDNPHSANATKWNKIYDKGDVKKSAGCDSGMGDEETSYEVRYANSHFTSVARSDWTYCHGTPHGFFSVGSDNLIWDQNSRKLMPDDIFVAGWEPVLKQLFWTALLAKGWKPSDDSARDNVEDNVVQPDQWSFTPAGLSVSFSAYAGGCYACNPGTTTVTWNALKSLLGPGSLAR